MAGTKSGAAQATKTIIGRYGLTEDGKSRLHVYAGKRGKMAAIANGGAARGGFAANRELASEAGRVGGSRPRKQRTAPDVELSYIDDVETERW